MSTYKNISAALGLVLGAMVPPGLAAEKLNGLNILITSPSPAAMSNDSLLQQLASDIITARLSRDGHHIRVVTTSDKSTSAKLRRVALKNDFQSKTSSPQISIAVRAKFKLRNKTYTRHASLHLETVIRNTDQNGILGRLRASAPTWRVPENCDADCVIETAHQRVNRPASQMARAIARKLKPLKTREPQQYRIKVTPTPAKRPANSWVRVSVIGFDNATTREIEDYLVAIQGNDDVQRAGSANTTTRFVVKRDQNAPPLKPLLQRMLKQLGATADIDRNKSQFTLKARLPGKTGASSINW